VTAPGPENSERDAALDATLARGLDRKVLDADALGRIRETCRAEFDALYRTGRSRALTLPRIAFAASILLAVFIGALAIQPATRGPVVASVVRIDNGTLETRSRRLFGRALDVGASIRIGDTVESRGAAVIQLDRGGTLRVAPGTRFTVSGTNGLELQTGRAYFDFPLGVHGFVVRSALGTVEHVGTQFEVALVSDGMRVRVREGAVRVRSASGTDLADAGTEILVASADPTVVRGTVPTYGPDWAWVDALAPEFEIENRPLADFLSWVARETGRRIEFADERARAVALRTRLHGSVDGLEPMQALDRVLSTTSLRCELQGGTIRVSSR
jgi:hypothetical protein